MFVTEHVQEKFSCRSCETIAQPPARRMILRLINPSRNTMKFNPRARANAAAPFFCAYRS